MDYSKIRLGVALPNTNATFPSEFVDSFFCLNRPFALSYLRPSTSGPLDTVRNELADLSLKENCTHIWYCDTDQVYPQDTLVQMLSHELPIVVAKVHMRKPPYSPMLRRLVDGEYIDISSDEWGAGGLVEVDGTGFGCVLLSTDVLRAIEKPWFKFELEKDPPVGEDFYFWAKAQAAGFKIMVDCDIKIGHLATFPIGEQSYFSFKYAQVWDRNESSDKAVGAPGQPSQISKVLEELDKI